MIRIKYEEYYNDFWRKDNERIFTDLNQISDWIFDQMQCDYSNPENGWLKMSFCCSKNGKVWDEPDRISFSPKYGGPDFWIHEMFEDGKIIFSDGKFTARQKYWTSEVKEWLASCHVRQYHPQFDFAEDKKVVKQKPRSR